MIKTGFRIFVKLALFLVLILVLLIAFVLFSPRPPNKTDPAIFSGDASAINYCELPELDGSGKIASDIPKGNTPGCGYERFPMPILAECTEPLTDGAQDIRGLWQAESGQEDHVERIEQCGSRTIVTALGIIHDYGPNNTGGLDTNDTEGNVHFVIGGSEVCGRASASMNWRDDKLEFNALGWGPVVVRRYLEGDQLVWEYLDGTITRMNRICTLPDAHKIPEKRGRRIKIF